MRSLSMRLISRCGSLPNAERREMKTTLSSLADAPWVRILGWGSVATGAIAVGFFVGRNLRARYRLNRRTPYDFYSHAGDNGGYVEYGVGI
jgi:hypothetical protein